MSFSTLLLIACTKSDQSHTKQNISENSPISETAIDAEHTAENALDWNGIYKGVLPCADCEGIKTELELNSDKTYELKETYLDKGDGKAFASKGKFTFDRKNGSIIELDKTGDRRKYFVAEGYLKALDTEGKEITGELAEKYELKKQAE